MGSKKEDQNYLNPLTYAFKARDISGPFIFGRRAEKRMGMKQSLLLMQPMIPPKCFVINVYHF